VLNHGYEFNEIRRLSERSAWRLEDVVGPDKRLDFARPFMPESLARTEELTFLSAAEQRTLNQIRGHSYLHIFIVFEEFVVPYLLDDVRKAVADTEEPLRALLQFANEETKHTQVFKQFQQDFREGFPVDCALIGPANQIGAAVRNHHPLAVGLLILSTEWVTQAHYLQSVRDDRALDPQFKNLLKYHWIEEAQHAKLDTLIVEKLAAALSPEQRADALEQYLALGTLFDGGFTRQAELDVDTLERAIGRSLAPAEREQALRGQHQAYRYTFLGLAMAHPKFSEVLNALDPDFARRVAQLAPTFC
jgi:hypothetical protein